ncbi:hypothetical protein [Teichococcus vastitatis]|uniref:Uncharacterized protein n=1 Tax=Teichococcus vastitatis TaxID=2307076 RepID=A0ABS9W7Q8_9PROT|nr:hypothetical protein [Pseudoroseomonas vastitatis]MCI0755332.1 hypothetical protein [Pseudoroseomonas vastitatis]
MAERKFAALANLRRPDPLPPEPPPAMAEPVQPAVEQAHPSPVPLPPPTPVRASPPVLVEAGKGRGRPPGKRSDPDWAPRTILMRSKTHRRVSIMLLERDDGPDLSELVDQLLTNWLSKQT